MSKLRQNLDRARSLLEEMRREQPADSFAHDLAAQSFQAHVEELHQLSVAEASTPVFELVDFRLIGSSLNAGSMPLRMVALAVEEIRRIIAYAALRCIQGGVRKQKVPKELYEALDLRLAGLLPGSTRLLVAAQAHRDLFDTGLAKEALDRVFRVLATEGAGREFLEAITELGPTSARSLKDFLFMLKSHSAEIEVTWRYSGATVRTWRGTERAISNVSSALAVTKITEQERVVIEGVIDLLSARERIDLTTTTGDRVRVLFPKKLLDEVSKLHLKQQVRLNCQMTQTENPMTGESSLFYELLSVAE